MHVEEKEAKPAGTPTEPVSEPLKNLANAQSEPLSKAEAENCNKIDLLTIVQCVTLPSYKRRQASKQRQRCGLSPKRPYPRSVVDPLSCVDNIGACLPYYYLTWTSQDVDT